MQQLKIYAFADEASASIDGQIAAMQRNSLTGIEIRGVDGQNISSITAGKAREVNKKLTDANLTVNALGSPIGKIDVAGDFAAHLEQLRHTLEIASILGTDRLRMFSFYMPQGKAPSAFKQQVHDMLGEMLRVSSASGVTLCHENEKGIYGDNAERCAEIHRAFPQIKGVFDPANFVQCAQDTIAAWELLAPYTAYLHIKDALADGNVVPAGKGIGNVKFVLDAFRAQGGTDITIEPHLSVFEGFSALEQAGDKTPLGLYQYASTNQAFDAACAALRALV